MTTGDERVLETTLAAPAARGLRSGLAALAFYASSPAAAPREAPADRALWGAAAVLSAARLVAADRRLLRAALPPTALTFVACAALASAVAAGREEGGWFRAAFAAFVALSSMPPTVLQPLWIRVGLRAREALGATPGEMERPGESYLRMILREGVKAARQAVVVTAGLAPALLLLTAIPWAGGEVALGAAGIWTAYWVVVDAFEIPMELAPGKLGPGEPPWFERGLRAAGARSRLLFLLSWAGSLSGRLARPWRNECRLTERHPWASLGLGVAAAAFLALPLVGVFFRAVVITAATTVVVRTGQPG